MNSECRARAVCMRACGRVAQKSYAQVRMLSINRAAARGLCLVLVQCVCMQREVSTRGELGDAVGGPVCQRVGRPHRHTR